MNKEMYHHIHQIEQNHWWYIARRKIIFDWVLKELAYYTAPKILDIGCGTGYNLKYLQANNYTNVTGLDFSPDALHFCRSRHLPELLLGDGTLPPFQQESFDVIMALDLIEHLADDVAALRELTRLLKPKGALIIFTPAFNFLWGLQDEVSHHYRRYTAPELEQKLGAAGLNIKKLTYANTFLFAPIWAGRLLLRLRGNSIQGTSENDLHPGWSNNLLQAIFAAEKPLLRRFSFPFGVSLLCVANKPLN
ncbi:MAG: Ubiquinone biosynthesis O-methyltransferase [Anaerolineae bacterium]|nr:Ubiquinone biosynthesis O-methyltransferase [Anaerolineae bacterium]